MNPLPLLKSFFDERYTRRPTFGGAMSDFLYWIILLSFAGSAARLSSNNLIIFPLVVWLGVALLVLYMFHYVRVVIAEKKRPTKLAAWADTVSARYFVDGLLTSTVLSSSLLNAAHLHGLEFKNVVEGSDWWMADADFRVEHSTKYGKYDAAIIYQHVLAYKLSRSVPNVFFDSKKYSARSFRWLIKSHQIDTLEGNFGKYFRVFSPGGWQIDMRAIISPDVMLSIMDLKEHDIELSGDYLYIYGTMPFKFVNNDDLLVRGKKLHDQLEDNLNTYRDDRLIGADRTKRIHSSGAVLGVRNLRLITFIVSVLLALIIRFLIGFYS